ncbi:MAG: cation transporter dimerization domain-containing protein [Clostridia bacterium]
MALLSLMLSQFVSFPLDGYLGVVIAVVVLVGGVRVLLDTISPLLGTPPSEELVRRIKELVLDHEEIVGVHDLIVHNYGPNKILASLHAEVPANSNIIFAHEIIDQAEREISEKLGITVLIHLDPIVIDDKRVNEMRENRTGMHLTSRPALYNA